MNDESIIIYQRWAEVSGIANMALDNSLVMKVRIT
jgi:hypothetical protein